MIKIKKNLKKHMKYIIFVGVNKLTIIIKYILSARPNLYSNNTQYTNITAAEQKTETLQTPPSGTVPVRTYPENTTRRRAPTTHVSRENAIGCVVSSVCVFGETVSCGARPTDAGLYL